MTLITALVTLAAAVAIAYALAVYRRAVDEMYAHQLELLTLNKSTLHSLQATVKHLENIFAMATAGGLAAWGDDEH